MKVDTIGQSFEHLDRRFNKWQNGFEGKDGCIYGIPLNAESVLKIVCATGETRTVTGPGGDPLRGNSKWEGGVVGNDGAIYCMPMVCEHVLRIAPDQIGSDHQR